MKRVRENEHRRKICAVSSYLPNVRNLEDYAGLENHPIDGVIASVSKGNIRYRVKLVGGAWLPWVTDRTDYAGIIGRKIDGIQMELTGVSGYDVEYRVSLIGTDKYLPWVRGYNNVNDDGYAGVYGKEIDKMQVRVVKK